MFEQQTLTIQTAGRATIEITAEVEQMLRASKLEQGLCHVFVHHTSTSLIITETADADAPRDLETYIGNLVRDGDPAYRHDMEV